MIQDAFPTYICLNKNKQKLIVKQNIMENLSFNKENLAYEKAAKRVKDLKSFYGNLISYCLVIPFLLIINLLTSPEHLWFYWPMLGWGLGLTIHGLNTFGIGKEWEERKINQLMEQEKNQSKSL